MPLGTLDRAPPPFFKQGHSALTKLTVCSALALFLMVADARFHLTQPLRTVVATAIYPLQWAAMQPVRALGFATHYVGTMDSARATELQAQQRMALQAQRAQQSEQLSLENARLRKLLGLRDALTTQAQSAEVLYDAADPYTRKVIIDKGLTNKVELGSPVIDELGVVGQVTRVHPMSSEVTLLIDREYTLPVLNTRTGARSVAYGDPVFAGGSLELRWIGGNSDVQPGDMLTTSGVDGVYPAGLAVAKIDKVERRADSGFARIHCTPLALVQGARHVMVLKPVSASIPQRPVDEGAGAARKGRK